MDHFFVKAWPPTLRSFLARRTELQARVPNVLLWNGYVERWEGRSSRTLVLPTWNVGISRRTKRTCSIPSTLPMWSRFRDSFLEILSSVPDRLFWRSRQSRRLPCTRNHSSFLPFSMSQIEILHAYRRLYRTALQAVHHATPAKYTIRDSMRRAFRFESPEAFESTRIENTQNFLQRAKMDTGMEHRILKNLLHVKYFQHYARRDLRLLVTSSLAQVYQTNSVKNLPTNRSGPRNAKALLDPFRRHLSNVK